MSDNSNPFEANEGEAPVLPGGVPELAGTGPHGAYPDGSVQPGEPVVDEPEGTDEGHGPDPEDPNQS